MSRLTRAVALAVAAPFLVWGCRDPFALPDGSFQGHYSAGFEVSAFRPCGADESWWTSGDLQPVFDAMPDSVPVGYGTVFVHWRGDLSGKGQYGHLGSYERELTVTQVLEAREPAANDCT